MRVLVRSQRLAAAVFATLACVTVIASPASASLTADPSVSLNRAGYAVNASSAEHVSASWVQPTVACKAATTFVSFLVRLSHGGSPLAEVGTAADCHHGRPNYYAWFRFADGSRGQFQRALNPVKAGDHVSGRVSVQSGGTITVGITDDTQDWTFGLGGFEDVVPNRALVLVQARTGAAGVLRLTDFGTLEFSHCTVNDHPMAEQNPHAIVMQTASGDAKTKTSEMAPPGSFAVLWLRG